MIKIDGKNYYHFSEVLDDVIIYFPKSIKFARIHNDKELTKLIFTLVKDKCIDIYEIEQLQGELKND